MRDFIDMTFGFICIIIYVKFLEGENRNQLNVYKHPLHIFIKCMCDKRAEKKELTYIGDSWRGVRM